jgi:hypothetical protein
LLVSDEHLPAASNGTDRNINTWEYSDITVADGRGALGQRQESASGLSFSAFLLLWFSGAIEGIPVLDYHFRLSALIGCRSSSGPCRSTSSPSLPLEFFYSVFTGQIDQEKIPFIFHWKLAGACILNLAAGVVNFLLIFPSHRSVILGRKVETGFCGPFQRQSLTRPSISTVQRELLATVLKFPFWTYPASPNPRTKRIHGARLPLLHLEQFHHSAAARLLQRDYGVPQIFELQSKGFPDSVRQQLLGTSIAFFPVHITELALRA